MKHNVREFALTPTDVHEDPGQKHARCRAPVLPPSLHEDMRPDTHGPAAGTSTNDADHEMDLAHVAVLGYN